jgi:hypothetical protein
VLGEVSFFVRGSQVTYYPGLNMFRDGIVKIEPVPAVKIWVPTQIVNVGTVSLSIRQLKIINYCIGDDFLCKCEKYDGKYDLEKGKMNQTLNW